MTGGKKGFTLMEMLVALAIFSTVVTITTDIFFSYQRTQRKTEELQKVVSTARFVSEAIVREVKEGTIDYGYTNYVRSGDALSNPQTVLALKDAEGRQVIFSQSGQNGCPEGSDPCIILTRDSGSESITPRGVRVNSLQFYISPAQDPYSFDIGRGAFMSNAQPRVTVFMSLMDSERRTQYDLQTTVVS